MLRQRWVDVKLAILKFVPGRIHQPPEYVKFQVFSKYLGSAQDRQAAVGSQGVRLVVKALAHGKKCLAWLLPRVLDS